MLKRLSTLQRVVLTPYFGIKAALDPTRGDMVAALGDSLGESAAKAIHKVTSSIT